MPQILPSIPRSSGGNPENVGALDRFRQADSERPDRSAPRPRRPAAGRVLPQAARRLDTRRELWPDEVRVRVETPQPRRRVVPPARGRAHRDGRVDGGAVRREVLEIVAERGKMQNPVTGSGGMLVGTVEEVGPESTLGLVAGDRVATLVSLSLTPLVIEDGLERLGRPQRAGPRRRLRHPVRALDRSRHPRRPAGRPQPGRDGRLRRARPDPPGRLRATSSPSSPSSAEPASPGRSAWRPRPTPAAGGPSASSPTRPRPPSCGDSRARRRRGRRRRPRPDRPA